MGLEYFVPRSFHERMDGFALFGLLVAMYLLLRFTWALWTCIKVFLLSPVLGLGADMRTMGEWAVITGATDGIGKACAEELARRGMNIVLISRTLERLQNTKKEIKRTSRVDVKIIVTDFTEGQEIYENIERELDGLDIGVLINNVGMSHWLCTKFHEKKDRKFLRNLVDVNCHSVVMMSHIVLPAMVAKRRGAILNISSGTATVPAPTVSTYSATKGFVDLFSQAVQGEVRDDGVIVQSCMTFFVATKMALLPPSLTVPTPEAYARSLLNTVGLVERTSGHWTHHIQMIALESLPIRWAQTLIQHMLFWMNEEKLKKK